MVAGKQNEDEGKIGKGNRRKTLKNGLKTNSRLKNSPLPSRL